MTCLLLLVLALVVRTHASDAASDTFHIRHYNGKCLEYEPLSQKLIFKRVCREHFRWKGGVRLIHVPTNRCLQALPSTKSNVVFPSRFCSDQDTFFQYDVESRTIEILINGRCFSPQEDNDDPSENSILVHSSDCTESKTKFWFVPQVLYVIRHVSGLCWKYNATDELIKLQNDYICDRFFQKNNKHLQHYETGKCVTSSGGTGNGAVLKLTSDCTSSALSFLLDNRNFLRMKDTTNMCVHSFNTPYPINTHVLLWECGDEDRIRMYFYDERGILDVKIRSEGCDDLPVNTPCEQAKGSITINSYQYSKMKSGINTVVFDYRSAIFEHSGSYSVFSDSTSRDQLASFLNNFPSGKILFMAAQNEVTINSNLANALRRHGVSGTFASTNIPNTRCSMASISSTDEYRQPWEQSATQANCVGASTLTKTIYLFRDLKGIDDCSEEMGIRTGKLPNSRFTSVWAYYGYRSRFARLHNKVDGWCAKNVAGQYIKVDLGARRFLTGIAIQSSAGIYYDVSKRITKFRLQYSINGINWNDYLDDETKAKKVFDGVKTAEAGDVTVNWFRRTLTRFIRVLPTEVVDPLKFCMRMELFGCSPTGPICSLTTDGTNDKTISKDHSETLSFDVVLPSNKIQIGVTTASSATSLAKYVNIEQMYSPKHTIIKGSGTVIYNVKNTENVKTLPKGLRGSLLIDYRFDDADYYNIDLKLKSKGLDLGRSSEEKSWKVCSIETEDRLHIIGYPFKVNRTDTDESRLKYELKHNPHTEYEIGDELIFNVSISHWPGKSFANAYNLQLFMYYDMQFLTLNSIENIQANNSTINATRNETSPGFINIQTDVLWFLTNHLIQFNFKFKHPNIIFKGKNCTGAILTDFAYQTNLGIFNGQFNTTLNKVIEYKCKISQTRSLVAQPGRITVAGFSILYDDVKNNAYVCRKITKYSQRNQPSCYIQKHGSTSWQGIPHIASVVGIDTNKQTLFGVNAQGSSYVELNGDLQTFWQVEDSIWISMQDKPHVRKAKSASDITSLPNDVEDAWVFPSSANQIIAATNKGIMRKSGDKWNLVLRWGSK